MRPVEADRGEHPRTFRTRRSRRTHLTGPSRCARNWHLRASRACFAAATGLAASSAVLSLLVGQRRRLDRALVEAAGSACPADQVANLDPQLADGARGGQGMSMVALSDPDRVTSGCCG